MTFRFLFDMGRIDGRKSEFLFIVSKGFFQPFFFFGFSFYWPEYWVYVSGNDSHVWNVIIEVFVRGMWVKNVN